MELTREELDATLDSDLESRVFEVLLAWMTGDFETLDDKVMTLSPGLTMMWGTFWIEGEVSNGGFHQYFWNSWSR